MSNFTHLHLHTYYSLLDGYSSPKEMVKIAKDLGMNALAITDHNHLAGTKEFYDACIDQGIKPILGYEAYYTLDSKILALSAEERTQYALEQARIKGKDYGFDIDAEIYKIEHPISEKTGKPLKPRKITTKELNTLLEDYKYDTTQFHLILLAKNLTGWKNIIKIQSESAMNCTYNGRYMCDLDLLKKYSEGVICATACIGSYFAQQIIDHNYQDAYDELAKFKSVFGDDFYIEIQPLNIDKQHIVNYFLIKYALENNIKIIATNDVHYAKQEDHWYHDKVVRMGIGKKIDDESAMVYSNDYWIRSYDEMITAFNNQYQSMQNAEYEFDFNYLNIVKQALENTNNIADQVEQYSIISKTALFSNVDLPDKHTEKSYLTKLCIQGLLQYKKNNPDIDLKLYIKRLYKELFVINSKGFANYLLTVKDYVDFCREKLIPVGPGRGSAAGSLCLFLLHITTDIDPIKYGLPFERFLTIDRMSPPDCIYYTQSSLMGTLGVKCH